MVIAPTVQIASLGMADSLILMVMALVVFGPRRLPQIGRQIGKLMYEFRKASNDFKFQMEEELRNSEEADRRKKEEERLRALALAAPAPTPVLAETSVAAPATEPVQSETPVTESVNPAAIYDNGPVAATQTADQQSADVAPTIMPPSIGETVGAARNWTIKYEQAKLAEAAKAAEAASIASTESSAPNAEPSAPDTNSASPVNAELAMSESSAQPASAAVNQHG
jgi:sec-independent protein translocase protein TatB